MSADQPPKHEKYDYAIDQGTKNQFLEHLKHREVQEEILNGLKNNNQFDQAVLVVLERNSKSYDIIWNKLFWHVRSWVWMILVTALVSFFVFCIPEIRQKISSWTSGD